MMTINSSSFGTLDYEILLAKGCDRLGAIAILKQYRPYLEMVPSLRRPQESLISIPLPIIKIRQFRSSGDKEDNNSELRQGESRQAVVHLPCDLAILMCDPQWKIKLESEILIFIQRPDEEFSELIGRWRQSQVYLEQSYEWIMPLSEQHMLSEGGDRRYPLFVVFEQTPLRIKRGLAGACLPYLVQSSQEETAGWEVYTE